MEIKTEKNCSKKLLSKDDTIFREYIENTTAHGVVRIFGKHYNIFRRLFWLVVFLGAAAGCLYNCIERISFLASGPTSTAVTIERKKPLVFPAVTICNLNYYSASGLDAFGLLDVGRRSLNIDPLDPDELRECERNLSSNPVAKNVILEKLNREGSQPLYELIVSCTFLGEPCDLDRDFAASVLGIGTCYTFNGISRSSSLKTNGTGSRQGLLLYLNIDQGEYTASGLLDAGIRVSIHPWYEPSQALDQGISIPPGRFAFIGMREERIINKAEVDCVHFYDINRLNFLSNTYDYSAAACLTDCLYTAIADKCNCYHMASSLPPYNPLYANIHNCTFSDTCCVQEVLNSPMDCNCPSACEAVFYDNSVSYSSFPAEYVKKDFENTLDVDLGKNLVGLSIYFRTLSVKNETTTYSYGFVALLSDIGGQLGLFLGISVISILEFGTWLLDEGLDRLSCFRISWKKKKKEMEGDQLGKEEREAEDAMEMEQDEKVLLRD